MKYIIDRALDLNNDAGFKARVDVVNTLGKDGYKYISLNYNSENIVKKMLSVIDMLTLKFNTKSQVIIQYPLNFSIIKYLVKKLKRKKCSLICLIHDIESLRKNCNQDAVKKEIDLFNKFDYIISHNKKMSEWLVSNGILVPIYNLEIFDYLCSDRYDNREPLNNAINIKKEIVYATGILGSEKSSFLHNIEHILSENCVMNLYGGIANSLQKQIVNSNNIIYKGSIPPHLVTNEISGHFGLIWDSTQIDTCAGRYSEYTKYNTPHKLSMYIACGIPVIAWKKSAISEFIIDNNIGICIDSLNEIKDIISNINEKDYIIMKRNIEIISKKIKDGYYIRNIMNSISNN